MRNDQGDELVYPAADRLRDAFDKILKTAPPAVVDGADWEMNDEDWLRDGFRSVQGYTRWRSTGEHNYMRLPDGFDPGRAYADEMRSAMSHLLPPNGYPEWHIPPDLVVHAERVARRYDTTRYGERKRRRRRSRP